MRSNRSPTQQFLASRLGFFILGFLLLGLARTMERTIYIFRRYFLSSVIPLLLFFANTLSAKPSPGVDISELESGANISQYLEYSSAGDKELLDDTLDWSKWQDDSVHFGFNSETYYFRLKLANPTKSTKEILFELDNPLLDKIDFYAVTGFGEAKQKTNERFLTGDLVPFQKRPLPLSENFVFPIKLKSGGQKTLLFAVKTSSSFRFNVIFWTPNDYAVKHDRQKTFLDIFYGILLVMIAYNLFLYVVVRDVSFLFYIVYITSAALFSMSLNGSAYKYFWPESPAWANQSVPFFIFAGFIGVHLFSKYYLDLKLNAPRLNRVLTVLAVISAIGLPTALFVSYASIIIPAIVLAIVSVVFVLWSAISSLNKDNPPAVFFLVAWSFLIFGIFVYALNAVDVRLIPNDFITQWSMQIGFSIEVVTLSMGLGFRINQLKREKDTAKLALLEQKVRMADSFSRFVPRPFLAQLNKESIDEVTLGDAVQKDFNVMFCDIRNFSKLTERIGVDATFRFLNAYLKRMTPAIRKHRGFVDKFIGDAIMGIFAEKSNDALDAAIEMRDELRLYNIHRAHDEYEPIEMGIGLSSGHLMLGTVGSVSRLDTTVIGDSVNLAARIESLTKVFKTPILLTGSVFDKLEDPGKYLIREVDRLQVRGKTEIVRLFECYDSDPAELKEQKMRSVNLLKMGMEFYQAGEFPEALERFREAEIDAKEDPIIQLYIRRCNALLERPPRNWVGLSRFR